MSETTPDRERVTARLPREVRERLVEAADRSGATLNQFVVQAAVEKAEAILERERVTRLSARDAEALLELLDAPPRPPNARLRKALDRSATSGDRPGTARRPARP